MTKPRCLTCKQTIVQVRKNHIYCSAKCRLIAWNLSHPRIALRDDKTEASRECPTQNELTS